METTQFIDQLTAGQAADAQSSLNDMLSARAFEALGARKVEIAKTIFNGKDTEEVEVQNTADEPVEQ
jgi:regulator of RNase E activity RraB